MSAYDPSPARCVVANVVLVHRYPPLSFKFLQEPARQMANQVCARPTFFSPTGNDADGNARRADDWRPRHAGDHLTGCRLNKNREELAVGVMLHRAIEPCVAQQ